MQMDRITENLEDLVRRTPEEEELIVEADLNGHVGESAESYEESNEAQKTNESWSRWRTYIGSTVFQKRIERPIN